ncbi:twin-arginine translocation signal domain-containing protein [Streptomyces sp. A7024]|uniref:Twin-arginine translocation signal domain-containing protein n=1 Tax=Streptomyces coryli TaxID=1128680 RepID=A0A6G4U220_9ACTN|nr:twin-arginine translocation signal domain-containing protein [Streptomyces coryli]NGN65800.1 twin-arginine translocation signal domain-containing protein [Streptomyces coryli]
MAFNRRRFLQSATAGGAALALGGLGARPALAAPGGFPNYHYVRTLLTPDKLAYNPTGEIIFPSIRGVYDKLADPLGRYYLYYAPHDAPGGICLAYGDSLEGPFTEYPGNPIVKNVWDPHYSVSHVSSPHVMWNADERELWLYFHGENTTTRLARSKDGITFTYDKTVLTTSMHPAGTTETSYARVFRYDLPSRGARYVMLHMRNDKSNHRDIAWGWSADGRDWEFAAEPLIDHAAVGANNVGGPHLLTRNGHTYVVYNTDKESGGNILITEVGSDFSQRDHLGVFYDSGSAAPENGRAASPVFGTENGVPYMIYEAGERLGGAIAVARG